MHRRCFPASAHAVDLSNGLDVAMTGTWWGKKWRRVKDVYTLAGVIRGEYAGKDVRTIEQVPL